MKFIGGVHFFCFRSETPFLGKFEPKNQNCQFQLKFGTSNMNNSVVMFVFSGLAGNYPLSV